MLNPLLIFLFTLCDSLCGCVQVSNLVQGRKLAAFLTSLIMATTKLTALLLVIRSTNITDATAYILGGTIGAQISFYFNRKTPEPYV